MEELAKETFIFVQISAEFAITLSVDAAGKRVLALHGASQAIRSRNGIELQALGKISFFPPTSSGILGRERVPILLHTIMRSYVHRNT